MVSRFDFLRLLQSHENVNLDKFLVQYVYIKKGDFSLLSQPIHKCEKKPYTVDFNLNDWNHMCDMFTNNPVTRFYLYIENRLTNK